MPRWLRRLLRRADAPGDSPEGAHEKRRPEPPEMTGWQAADRAGMGGFWDVPDRGRRR